MIPSARFTVAQVVTKIISILMLFQFMSISTDDVCK